MNRGVSLYLDVVRFGAAFIVFLAHYSSQPTSGGFLWQSNEYSGLAVMVFFVLSGFVIAHVTVERERDLKTYAVARFSRLYSIVIPALVITTICQAIVRNNDPYLYYDAPWIVDGGDTWAHFFATATLTNMFWLWPGHMNPLLNNPFWSLSYEATYYIAAGLIFFTRGWPRIISLVVVCAFAGPGIVSLAPIWFMGVGIYFWKNNIRLPAGVGLALALTGIVLMVYAPAFRDLTSDIKFDADGQNLLTKYFEAIAFCINLIGMLSLGPQLEKVLGWCARPIRYLSSLTFPLYLFHWPLIVALTSTKFWPVDTWQHRIYIFVIPLLIVATVGWWCDRQKSTIVRWLTIKLPQPVTDR